MKHTWKITLLLFFLFLVAHGIGLFVLDAYQVKDYPYGFQPPEIKSTSTSLIEIFVSLFVMTILVLILIRFHARRIWKVWFFISLVVTLLLALAAFVDRRIALAAALGLALWRILKNNVYVHNFTEVFVYGGLASLFVPILNLISISVLLLVIAVYDYIAVYKTKHMVAMAKFQAEEKIFAGLFVPYQKKAAILGGGDIGFTLLFSGVMLQQYGWWAAIISSLFAGFSLLVLLLISKRNKFYPAMPFLAAGCFIALGIVYLLNYSGAI